MRPSPQGGVLVFAARFYQVDRRRPRSSAAMLTCGTGLPILADAVTCKRRGLGVCCRVPTDDFSTLGLDHPFICTVVLAVSLTVVLAVSLNF
jgi:hypothetical protein